MSSWYCCRKFSIKFVEPEIKIYFFRFISLMFDRKYLASAIRIIFFNFQQIISDDEWIWLRSLDEKRDSENFKNSWRERERERKISPWGEISQDTVLRRIERASSGQSSRSYEVKKDESIYAGEVQVRREEIERKKTRSFDFFKSSCDCEKPF